MEKKEVMTPEEFAEDMNIICESDDREVRHIYADRLMCELLISLGYEEGVDVFKHTPKWYA